MDIDFKPLFIAGNKNVSKYLRFSEQQIISSSAFAEYNGNDLELISPQVMCAMGFNLQQGACQVDAGAPLIVNKFETNTLIGLLSFVHQNGNFGQLAVPAAFTRITSYLNWIAQVTRYQIRP